MGATSLIQEYWKTRRRFLARWKLNLSCLILFGTPAFGAQTSELWGAAGEKWTPESRLPDFGFAGYRRGQESFRTPTGQISVESFGAKGDGTTNDTEAFKTAIHEAEGKILLVPAGRFILSDSLDLAKSNTILRGAGGGKTVLLFSKPLDEIHPLPVRNGDGTKTTGWSWSGGLIMIGSNKTPIENPGVPLTEEAKRGANKLKVGEHQFKLGDEVILYVDDDSQGSLLSYLYRGQTGDTSGLRNWKVHQIFQITALSGNDVTLDRALRFDARLAWRPRLAKFTPGVTDVGVEGISFEFPAKPYLGHFKEVGFNPVAIGASAAHCWLRDISVWNADSGPFINGAFCTIDGVRIGADRRRTSAEGVTGHHGITFYGDDCLCTNFSIETMFFHDLSVQSAMGCVFSKGKAVNLCMDHHRWAPYENLFTEIDAGEGTRLFTSSGTPNRGAHSAAGATFWNIHSKAAIEWPKDFGPDEMNLVALKIRGRNERSLSGRWLEGITPGTVQPPNIYVAMAQRRQEAAAAPARGPVEASSLHWTTSDGRQFSAELIRVQGLTVTLKINGVVHEVPLSRLSSESQALARQLAGQLRGNP